MFRRIREDDAMLARLFFRLLPVQAAIVAMGSINAIVDGVVASRFIDPSTVGVVGLELIVSIPKAGGQLIIIKSKFFLTL